MKTLKTLLALLLVLTMLFTLCACGADAGVSDKKDDKETEETTEPEPEFPPVTIGAITIEYESAILYDPYEDGNYGLLVYFNITNISEETVKPGKIVFANAYCDGEYDVGLDYLEDARPELYNSFYNEIAPGETARCMLIFNPDEKGSVYEITVMDLYHKIEEKLVITIDTADLEITSEA